MGAVVFRARGWNRQQLRGQLRGEADGTSVGLECLEGSGFDAVAGQAGFELLIGGEAAEVDGGKAVESGGGGGAEAVGIGDVVAGGRAGRKAAVVTPVE